MRINQFVAKATGMSRREADKVISSGALKIDGRRAELHDNVTNDNHITLQGRILHVPDKAVTIMLNKPVGYVCSRNGQGSKTVYSLLPQQFHNLKTVGRLDKDSSGLLLLTSGGSLANQLTHPKYQKEKVYEVELNKDLSATDQKAIEQGVELEDGLSKLRLEGQGKNWTVKMNEGRNRQIRRTFEKLGYQVTKLHRTKFGDYTLSQLQSSQLQKIS